MKKLRWLAILMTTVILAIAGFQVYWLLDNYRRASRELDVKTGLLFRETYRQVQDSVLRVRLQLAIEDSNSAKLKLSGALRMAEGTSRALGILNEEINAEAPITMGKTAPQRVFLQNADSKDFLLDSIPPSSIREINIFSKTGAATEPDSNNRRVLTGDISFQRANTSLRKRGDTSRRSFSQFNTIYVSDGKEHNIVIRIDSLLSDSVRQTELEKKFGEALDREGIAVPFSIVKQADHSNLQVTGPSELRWRGISRETEPFQMQLGSRVTFLLKQLSLPILFSVFLVGITCLSFLLLYRSLRHQQRLSQMKSDLVSNITHELKTPIATVGVAIEALKNFNAIQDPERTKEYLDISQQELHRLGLLVDKVLKLSMFEKQEMDIQPQLFNLGELVNEVVASLRLQLEKYHARLTIDQQGDLNLKGDRTHLQSVVFNLIDNALKYSKANPAIHISLIATDQDIEMKVTDNGLGIPEAYQQKVFEKFFRVPAGDTHNAKGHGLGLSYVAQVVRQHGGSISLDSHENLGSTFTIRLPREASNRANHS